MKKMVKIYGAIGISAVVCGFIPALKPAREQILSALHLPLTWEISNLANQLFGWLRGLF
jgi:hypothetical protein